MAVPRVFISSTCQDIKEIRFQLRQFIEEMGFVPVMSEYGDIFYNLDKHVQDACKEEILRSNLFILIVGNNYGNLYHRHGVDVAIPDSVTLHEFRKALEVGIPKFIFVNNYVQHDFDNYRKVLDRQVKQYFSEINVADEDIEKTLRQIKERFDLTYPFSEDSYRYVFYFLDIIYNLDINNAVFPFESFEEIRDKLRKQWAGFFYDALTKERTIAIEKVEQLGKRLDKIERHLRTLAESSEASQDNSKITVDIKKLASEFNFDDLEKMQEKISEIISTILYDWDRYGDSFEGRPRFTLLEPFNPDIASTWLSSLNGIIQNYKWSKYIPITEILKGKYKYWKDRGDVPYKSLFELCGIFNGLS